MGSLIEMSFNLSVKKQLIRDRNLTPARDVLMKGCCQCRLLAWGDQTKIVGGLIYVGQQLLRRNQSKVIELTDCAT